MKRIAKELGYSKVSELYEVYGYNRQQISKIKKRNLKRYNMILTDIIIKELLFNGGDVEHSKLIDVLSSYNKQLEAIKEGLGSTGGDVEKCK